MKQRDFEKEKLFPDNSLKMFPDIFEKGNNEISGIYFFKKSLSMMKIPHPEFSEHFQE